MNAIIDLTKDDDVRKVATPSNIKLGHEIVAASEVKFGAFKPELIEATVQAPGATKRRTKFELKNGQLTWHCTCTCTGNPKLFCKHLVATALAAQREGRGDIYKAAGIILKDRKMLVERSVGKPAYIAPGGRIEPGETAIQALQRELNEEFGITVQPSDLQHFGDFSAVAANHPGQQVHMQVFLVHKWQGDIAPANEVERILWLGSDLPQGVEIGSIFGHEVLPRLKQKGLVD